MSTPTSHSSSRGASQRPTTPDQTRPSFVRSASLSVAPKSEYLRNALQARRAQNPHVSSPFDMRSPPTASKPSKIKLPETSPDIFAEYALTEEQTTPVSPIRRRRPSDVGLPRAKTNRELTNEIERLKDTLMTTNMRVELLKKSNSELQHELTNAKERIEDLEPLEQENHDLQVENDHLNSKLATMDEEIGRLRDANDEIRQTNTELVAIADESASHWQDQEYAIDEAAECIIKLEEEKSKLVADLQMLKERVTALEDNSRANTLVDGSPGRYPSRVFSVDESRPSTSHFDSDYYSQPASPHVQPSMESITSITPSERSRKFLDLTEERRQSARDLVKRISAASLKALNIRSPSPTPEVPQVPLAYQQQVPRIVEEGTPKNARTPGRYRKVRQSLLDASPLSSGRSNTVVPQSPTLQSEGLRSLYRPNRTMSRTASRESRISSEHVTSPTKTGSFRSRSSNNGESSPRVPSHDSSMHAYTNSSSEHLQRRSPQHRRQSESDIQASNATTKTITGSASSEWAPLAAPSVPILSEDLTTDLDPEEEDNKDRWWRSIDRLTLSQVLAQPQLATQPAQPVPSVQPIMSDVASSSAGQDESNIRIRSSRSYERKPKPKPKSTPMTAPGTPMKERDFLFNVSEDTEAFMKKAKAKLGGRRQP